MGQQIKMKEHVSTKMNALGPSNNTEWQYCPVNKLIQEKAMYDRFMEEQKLLNTIVNKVHPLTGESLIQEKSLEELANATHTDHPAASISQEL